jgi:hypothetical protein
MFIYINLNSGSIQFVSIQDIESGKVKLPDGVAVPKSNSEREQENL